MNNLDQKMQERLDKWRKNTLEVKSVEKVREKTSVSNYIPRRGDYGDDMENPVNTTKGKI
jgi:hypothetical protein